MEDSSTLLALPAPDLATFMDLIQGMIALEADSPSHPHGERCTELTSLAPAMIWAWAKRDPSATWTLAKLLEPPSAVRFLHLLAGHAFLASAFHGKKPAIPFELRIGKHEYRDEAGEANAGFHLRAAVLDDARAQWPQSFDGADPLDMLLGAFEGIVRASLEGWQPELGVLSADAVLLGYDAKACKRIDLRRHEG